MADIKFQNYATSRLTQFFRPLEELLPLDTPLSLMIDPSNICNLKCAFCPTGDDELISQVNRSKGMMQPELFHKIIDGLAEFPNKIQVLHLYKDGEPLTNKYLADMVAYVKQSDHVVRVETTTNGILLTSKRSKELIDAGIDGIRISIQALNDVDYYKITRTPAKFENIKDNVASLYALKTITRPTLHVHCKIIDSGMSDEAKNLFLSTFAPISDSIHIDSIAGWCNSHGHDFKLGLNPQYGMSGVLRVETRKACPEPFMRLAVNHNGNVSVCCADWAHDTVVGDVNVKSLFDIWHGPALKELRLKHLTGQRLSLPSCDSCDYIYGLPSYSNIDHLVDQLMPIYS